MARGPQLVADERTQRAGPPATLRRPGWVRPRFLSLQVRGHGPGGEDQRVGLLGDDPARLEFRLAADVPTAQPAPEVTDLDQFEARRGCETSHLGGRPEIPNGLALCKIHHGAFDTHILGVSPDYRVAIRADVLEEIDGPMLRHGLQEMHGHLIHVPAAARLRPNPDYLAERFERFRAA